MRFFQFVSCVAVVSATFSTPLSAESGVIDTSAGSMRITQMAKGLDEPWGLAFLPDGSFLVTERDGRVQLFDPDGGAARTALAGLPEVRAVGQGGLLDIMVPRDFQVSRQVYLSFSKEGFRRYGTALGVGRLSQDATRLEDFEVVFNMDRGGRMDHHYGSRIVEAQDGSIFLTVGDRGIADEAQNLGRHEGSVIRISRNGSVPADNPFRSTRGAKKELFSKGHRNAQGAALDAQGRLWLVEHGAEGGDELNLVEPGRNYGWPVITHGRDYGGAAIGEGTAKAGLEQPAHYWDPSIAPSGLAILSDRMFPEWAGDMVVGSLKFDYLVRLDPETGFTEEILQAPEMGRVRDVREGPDGAIWFLSVHDGAVYRMARAP